MLEIRDLTVSYGAIEALGGVTLAARPGAVTAVLGVNGAGKSSLFKAVAGLVPAKSGSIRIEGKEIAGDPPHLRARAGISLAMEGRRLFHNMSVEENLRVAWEFRRGHGGEFRRAAEGVYGHFPVLAEKRKTASRFLSGGQQQMLILSCAMIRNPRYLLLDEPSLGLAPVVVTHIFQFIGSVCRAEGTTVLLSEQMASLALRVADYGYVLRRGRIVLEGDRRELSGGDGARNLGAAYLGGKDKRHGDRRLRGGGHGETVE